MQLIQYFDLFTLLRFALELLAIAWVCEIIIVFFMMWISEDTFGALR